CDHLSGRHRLAHHLVCPGGERFRERSVIVAGCHDARHDASVRVPLQPPERLENLRAVVPSIERHHPWATSKRHRHQIVAILHGHYWYAKPSQPTTERLRQLAAAG